MRDDRLDREVSIQRVVVRDDRLDREVSIQRVVVRDDKLDREVSIQRGCGEDCEDVRCLVARLGWPLVARGRHGHGIDSGAVS